MGSGNGAGDGAVAGVGLIHGVVLLRPLRGRFLTWLGLALDTFVPFLQLDVVHLSGNQR